MTMIKKNEAMASIQSVSEASRLQEILSELMDLANKFKIAPDYDAWGAFEFLLLDGTTILSGLEHKEMNDKDVIEQKKISRFNEVRISQKSDASTGKLIDLEFGDVDSELKLLSSFNKKCKTKLKAFERRWNYLYSWSFRDTQQTKRLS